MTEYSKIHNKFSSWLSRTEIQVRKDLDTNATWCPAWVLPHAFHAGYKAGQAATKAKLLHKLKNK